ncbi:MAG: cytochrome b5 domain-containing protein, partial [Candidatus Aminicenantales bacterium]
MAKNNGGNGSRAFIAFDGKVYDVTDSDLWSGGDHMGAHQAGKDLT